MESVDDWPPSASTIKPPPCLKADVLRYMLLEDNELKCYAAFWWLLRVDVFSVGLVVCDKCTI